MAENVVGAADDVVTERTCGICLEDSKDPLNLPCGHSFCDACLVEWRSRYRVKEEMRRKCPICRAKIPPSKEMVAMLLGCRADKQKLEDKNDTSSEHYRWACRALEKAEESVGADWDGITVLENDKPEVVMPEYIVKATQTGNVKLVLKWINSNKKEDRANAITSAATAGLSALSVAAACGQVEIMTLLLQLGANVDFRDYEGGTALIQLLGSPSFIETGNKIERARLLLSWGASFFPEEGCSREESIAVSRNRGVHEIANLLESELGGRRCEIIDLSSRPELNGKTCVAEEYLPDSNQYKVTLETKSKEVVVLGPGSLKRRDRTPQDCGYYVEFKNGRTIRHDFDSNEDCQAFVAALNNDGETQPAVTEESEARAEQAAAELLAELELDDSPIESSGGRKTEKFKKKKGGK